MAIIVTTAGARQSQAAGWVVHDIRIRSHRALNADRPQPSDQCQDHSSNGRAARAPSVAHVRQTGIVGCMDLGAYSVAFVTRKVKYPGLWRIGRTHTVGSRFERSLDARRGIWRERAGRSCADSQASSLRRLRWDGVPS